MSLDLSALGLCAVNIQNLEGFKMKAKLIMTALLAVGLMGSSRAGIDIGISADESGIKAFYLAIGDHYKQPEKEIIVVRDRGIPDEELPVVFYLASRAGISPTAIIKLRLAGKSWMDITFHYGLTAEIFYIDLGKDPGPPYGKAYGHFKKMPRKKWSKIVLGDPDIVNFVNLRFLSSHYGYSPNEIINMRSKGQSFTKINANIKKSKQEKKSSKPAKPAKGKSKAKKKK
jgi:hypothetical protein